MGSAVAVLGIHMVVGGAVGVFMGMLKPLWVVDGGPMAVVGTDLGPIGLTVGVFVALVGFFIRAGAKRVVGDGRSSGRVLP
ncbi:MAG: hypothetical protein GEU79_12875 [Acidimicrobiia bacterium]|nr:hypothetical protein [Acidimicrobiia bacterium]